MSVYRSEPYLEVEKVCVTKAQDLLVESSSCHFLKILVGIECSSAKKHSWHFGGSRGVVSNVSIICKYPAFGALPVCACQPR
jgi:hypothetical protein